MAKPRTVKSSRELKRKSTKPQLFSMTGFGQHAIQILGVQIVAEVKSVNNRYLDIVCKLPRVYGEFESALKAIIGAQANRGRIELNVQRKSAEVKAGVLELDGALFSAYWNKYSEVLKKTGLSNNRRNSNEITALVPVIVEIMRRDGVLFFSETEKCSDKERNALLDCVAAACAAMNRMRAAEGAALLADLQARLEMLAKIKDAIARLSGGASGALHQRLLQRIEKLAPEIKLDQQRLAAEISILADRIDISEELVRIASHLDQAREALQEAGSAASKNSAGQTNAAGRKAVGRKFEFLLQEFGREFNTVGSKCQDAGIQSLVVEAKTEIEKLREQVQNVE